MKEKKEARNQWLNIRLNEKEARCLLMAYQKTTARSMSEYTRTVLLKGPLTVRYRNASADDFLVQMLTLKKELQAIAFIMQQAVVLLQKSNGDKALKAWALHYQTLFESLLHQTNAMMEKAHEIHQLWSQK